MTDTTTPWRDDDRDDERDDYARYHPFNLNERVHDDDDDDDRPDEPPSIQQDMRRSDWVPGNPARHAPISSDTRWTVQVSRTSGVQKEMVSFVETSPGWLTTFSLTEGVWIRNDASHYWVMKNGNVDDVVAVQTLVAAYALFRLTIDT